MSDVSRKGPERGRPAAYEVRVRGELAAEWSDRFAGMCLASSVDGDTCLTGILDQAALHGVLRTVRDLGLPLISVTRIESALEDPAGSTESKEATR